MKIQRCKLDDETLAVKLYSEIRVTTSTNRLPAGLRIGETLPNFSDNIKEIGNMQILVFIFAIFIYCIKMIFKTIR